MNSYLKDIYKLAYIKRYSNVPKLHEESVAEHSFFVAAIVMKLAEKYEFDVGIACIISVSHDMPEMELNDVPYTIKAKYPKIKQAFQECEEEVTKTLPLDVQQGVHEFDAQTTIESQIVKLADAIQVKQFAAVELKLGNTGHMEEVYANSNRRINDLEQEIRHALR